jgi:hemoglobin
MQIARITCIRLFALALAFAASNALAQQVATPAMNAPNPAQRDPALRPLFKVFGEKPGLVAIVNTAMNNLVDDRVTRPYFINADRKHVKRELVDQLCVIMDGPCTYSGLNMAQAHQGLKITTAAFDAFVEDFQRAMDKHHIPFHDQNQLLARLAPMHQQIVTH